MEMCQKEDTKKRGRDSCIVAAFEAVWILNGAKLLRQWNIVVPSTKAWQ